MGAASLAAPSEKPTVPKNILFTDEAFERAKKNLRDKFGRASMGLDPSIYKDLFVVGGYHFERGVRNFAEWSKKMLEVGGEDVKPYLADVWKEVKKSPEAKEVKKTAENNVTVAVDELAKTINKNAEEYKTVRIEQKEETRRRATNAADYETQQKAKGRTDYEKIGQEAIEFYGGGELTNYVRFEPLRGKIPNENALFEKISNDPKLEFRQYKKTNLRQALTELLDGYVLSPGQSKLLGDYFGGELKKAVDNQIQYARAGVLLEKLNGLEKDAHITLREARIIAKHFPAEEQKAWDAVSWGEKFWEVVPEWLNIPRTTLSSYDISGVLRQGRLATAYPDVFKEFVKKYGVALRSEEGAKLIETELKNSPRYEEFQNHKGELTEWGEGGIIPDVMKREERFIAARWLYKIPGIRASERSFVVGLNWLRVSLYDKLITAAELRAKESGQKMTAKEREIIAATVNDISGRSAINRLRGAKRIRAAA